MWLSQLAVHRPLDHVRLDELIVPKQCPWLKIGGKDIIAHQPLKIMAVARLLIGGEHIFIYSCSACLTKKLTMQNMNIYTPLPPPQLLLQLWP